MEPNLFSDFQLKFFKRINREPKIIKTLDDISDIMFACSQVFSFENLDIVNKTYSEITKESLIEQVLERGQSGLCYKLNSLFFLFLKEFNFNITSTTATVENQETHQGWAVTAGHVINILKYQNRSYLVDIGFGCFLSFKPIPFKDINEEGEELELVESLTGTYRIRKLENEIDGIKYTHFLEHKKPDTFNNGTGLPNQFVGGYAFNTTSPLDESKYTTILTKVQQLIVDDPKKEFSVKPLATKIINNQSVATLIFNALVITNCTTGEKIKTTFNEQEPLFKQFNTQLESVFKIPSLKVEPTIYLNNDNNN